MRPTSLAACALALTACLGAHGRIRSGTPLTYAARPDPPRQAVCGRVREVLRTPLVRAPYLQDVRETSAILRWTSEDAAEHVTLWAPDAPETIRRIDADPIGEDRGFRNDRIARIDALVPGGTYCYALRGANDRAIYGPVTFRVAPPRDGDDAVSAIVLGDSGGGGRDQRTIAARLLEVRADLAMHVGDLAYPFATRSRLDQVVFDMYEPLLRAVPFFPALGNHDVHDGGASYLEAFTLPRGRGPDGSDSERYYSFDWGPMHVAVLDTTGRDLEQQARWLDRDLEASDAPWKIVTGHHPPYSSGWHGNESRIRASIVPVLRRRGVRLMISGHDHHYERSRELDGVTYVVTGGGGHSTRDFTPGPQTEVSEAVLHFVHLHVTRDTIVLRAIDATGVVFDSYAIERAPGM